MADFFKVSSTLAAELSNPFFKEKDDATSVKGGLKWDEDFVVQDFRFLKDAEDPMHETVNLQVRVPVDSDSPNRGRQANCRWDFYWAALQAGTPANRVMQTQIAYRQMQQFLKAVGIEEELSPGEVDPDDVRGAAVRGQVRVATDKKGILRQNVEDFTNE